MSRGHAGKQESRLQPWAQAREEEPSSHHDPQDRSAGATCTRRSQARGREPEASEQACCTPTSQKARG